MKNRKGSTLIITIMVFIVLMILSSTILTLMLTNNKQAVAHRNKIQAYYIARSGVQTVEAAILDMSDEEIEELEKNKELELTIDPNQIGYDLGKLENLMIEKEENSLIIKSKARVANSFETVEKIIGKDKVEIIDQSGYRGVIKKHDTIDYLGPASKITEYDGGKYKEIDGIKYEVIEDPKYLEGKTIDGKNYYLNFKIEDSKLHKELKISNSNIYTKEEIKLELDSINIENSSIISENKIEIEAKNGNITINNSTILSYGNKDENDREIEIEAEGGNGNIEIRKSVIKSREEIDIEIKNGNINIYDSTIIAGDSGNKGEIEIETKNGTITIDENTIGVGKIEIETKNGKKENSLIKKTMEDLGNINDLPGMPGSGGFSNTGDKINSYKPGYFR